MLYDLSYDYSPIARVQIADTPVATSAIKEMVEFWSGWEADLERNGGDHTRVWLKKLAMHILYHGSPPRDEEGWYPLEGERGIWVEAVTPYEFDDDLIEVEERTK